MSQYRVLVADDEKSIQLILARVIQKIGWEVVCASNGDEALELLQKNSFQIFTLDVKMPGTSGHELAQKILEKEAAPAIIILTGYAEVEQAVQAVKEGVFEYVQKETINPEKLRSLLLRAAKYHESRIQSIDAAKEREKTVHNIETANHQFRMVFELTQDLIFILDAKTHQLVDCNQSACKKLQYAREELLKQTFDCIASDWHEDSVNDLLESAFQRDTPYEMDFIKRDGKTFPVEAVFAYLGIESGEMISVVARDISKRKEMERQLLYEQNLLHSLMDNIPDHIYFKDTQHRYFRVNQAFAKRYGLSTPEEAHGKTLDDFRTVKHQANVHEQEKQIFATQQAIVNQLSRTQLSDGKMKYYSITKVPLIDSSNQVKGLVGITRDITELQNAKIRMETQAKELSNIIEKLDEGIILCNQANEIVEVNGWMSRLIGKPKELIIGEAVYHLFNQSLNSALEEAIRSLQGADNEESQTVMSNYQDLDLQVILQPVYLSNQYHGLIATIQDVTDLLESSAQATRESEYINTQMNSMKGEILSSIETIYSLVEQARENEVSPDLKSLLDVMHDYCGNIKTMLATDE